MENENQDVDLNNEVVEKEETQEETAEKLEPKRKFTPEEQLAIHKRETKKLERQLGLQEEPQTESRTKSGSVDLTDGQLALLRVDGIKGKEEIALAKEYIAMGKSLLDVMENKYFLQDLADLRESKAVKEAIPSTSKRATPSSKDEVEYWLNKPFNEVPKELRGKVVNARIAKERDNSMFTDNAVIS